MVDNNTVMKDGRCMECGARGTDGITSSIPNSKRHRELREWTMTIEDIYLSGEDNPIANINKWKDEIRNELR